MQEIVIRLDITSEKCRTKALKTASAVIGVISMSSYEDQLVVIGDVDSVRLTIALRRKFPDATLLSVKDLNATDDDEEEAAVSEPEDENKPEEGLSVCYCNHNYRASPSYQVVVYDSNPNACSIL